MTYTETLTLGEAAEGHQEREEEIRAELEDLREEAADYGKGSPEAQEVEEEYARKREEVRDLAAKRRTFERLSDQWSTDSFTIKELTFGELQRARDETGERSYSVDQTGVEGYPREGYYRLQVLNLAVVGAPSDAPDDPKDWPLHLGEWLYEKVDQLNSTATLEGNEIPELWDD